MPETHKIRLIGLDLDGTLLNEQKKITGRTKDVIERAVAAGIAVLPATGRLRCGIPDEVLSLPGIRYAVTTNGASVWDLKTNTLLYSRPIPVSDAIPLIAFLRPFHAVTQVYMNSQCYLEEEEYEQCLTIFKNTPFYDYVVRTHIPVKGLTDFLAKGQYPVEKINQITTDPHLKKEIWAALSCFPNINVTSSVPTHLEINHIDADKGKGLLALGAHLGILASEIMACGDGYNDLLMLKAVGLGVAMGNAEPEVKEAAAFITLTNEEDGVAHAIESLVLS